MPMISVRDNENNRWKRNANYPPPSPKKHKRTRGTKAILKGWVINDFVVRLT